MSTTISEPIDLATAAPFALGRLHVEPALRQVRPPLGEPVVVEPRVMQVLIALNGSADRPVSRARLQDLCWGGRAVSSDAIDRVIGRIRRLSEGVGADCFTIETIPRVGYCLRPCAPPPAPVASPAPEPAVAEGRWPRRLVLAAGVGAIAVSAVGGIALSDRRTAPGPRADGPLTIAVLPFDASGQPTAIADLTRQLTGDIRADLSRTMGLRVIAETSSRAAATLGGSATEIGARLGADLLLEGTVVGGSDVDVRMTLVDTRDGHQLWTTAASQPPGQPVALREELSGTLAEALAGLIPAGAGRSAPSPPRRDPQAYALVSEADRLLEDIRTAAMRGRRADALALGDRAAALAQQALAIDAHDSGALMVLAAIVRNGWTTARAAEPLTTEQRVTQSIGYVRRALLADPNDPLALTQLGDYDRRYAFRWDAAENLFRRALAIDPNLVDAHWSYAYQLGVQGRAVEGLRHALTVVQLDPGNPFRRVALPRLLYLVGQRDTAMRFYDREISLQPDNVFLLRELYLIFISEGNARDMAALHTRIVRQWSVRAMPADVAGVAARTAAGAAALTGAPQALRAMIDADVAAWQSPGGLHDATPQGRAHDDLPYIFAIENAWAGRPGEAIDMLDRALSAKSLYWPATLPYGQAPFPRAVQDDARYAGLWQRDPGLADLIARRARAIRMPSFDGFTPAGVHVAPRLDGDLVRQVQAALRRIAAT